MYTNRNGDTSQCKNRVFERNTSRQVFSRQHTSICYFLTDCLCSLPPVQRQCDLVYIAKILDFNTRQIPFLSLSIVKFHTQVCNHTDGGISNSDWFVNSFVMVVYETIILVALGTANSD